MYEGNLLALSPQQRNLYWSAWHSCCESGYKELAEADSLSRFIPNIARRDKVRAAITAAISSLQGTNPKQRIITALSVLLIEYLVGVCDQNDEIKAHVKESENWFKAADYYWNLLH
jgi:predicted translin family RNA/ssDNA-binding protein